LPFEILNFEALSPKEGLFFYYFYAIMLKLIAKLFGTKSEKDIKLVMPLVEATKREGEKLVNLSNDELRQRTFAIQAQINADLKFIDDQLAALHKQVADQPQLDLNDKEAIFAQIDKLELPV